MTCRGCLAVLVVAVVAFALGAQVNNERKAEKSPHAGALELVFKTQQAQIREADGEDWWHDVKDRTWTVRRPFFPGNMNTCNWFDVSYSIAGREVASWFVDTAKGEVQMRKGAKKRL